ncbi:MAG TPA: HAMP domain-containing histidine kinase [Calditrichaeota bacterium]|nr:HAMP domain-containing histidine kinase [Calditrichota bacterium]
MYSIARPIENRPYCQDCHKQGKTIAYLDVDVSLTPAERAFYTGSFHIIMLSVLIVILLVSGFYYLFNRFINSPVQSFISALDKVKAGNMNIRLPAKKKDEFGILEQHFNHMVNTVEQSHKKIEEMHIEQLQRADKLVTLGELAAEMAHEINNPAAVIMTRADYLRLELDKQRNGNTSHYLEDLDVILSQTDKISKITSSMLKYSKKLPKDFKKINIFKLIDESIRILEPRLKKKNIYVNKEYQCKYDCQEAIVYGDETQIDQMLTNIINNAIDAMEVNGILTIKVECLSNYNVRLSIADNGCGIDEKAKGNIFSPFFTTKGHKNGTGLGLYIVKNICKNHNAEIICSSAPDQGTTFTITFNGANNR